MFINTLKKTIFNHKSDRTNIISFLKAESLERKFATLDSLFFFMALTSNK